MGPPPLSRESEAEKVARQPVNLQPLRPLLVPPFSASLRPLSQKSKLRIYEAKKCPPHALAPELAPELEPELEPAPAAAAAPLETGKLLISTFLGKAFAFMGAVISSTP